MSDEQARALERRWRSSGAAEDEAAWLMERARSGDEALSDAFFQERIRLRGRDGRALYAAWLRAMGQEARAAYLEAEAVLAAEPESAMARAVFLSRRGAVDRLWLAPMEEPSLLRSAPLPGPRSWWSVDLGPARPAAGTYGRFDYASLPDLEPSDYLDFRWLEEAPELEPRAGREQEVVGAWRERLEAEGFPQPERLYRLFLDLVPRRAIIDSCTDCYFSADEDSLRFHEDAAVITFYRDSQDCVAWSLWWQREGNEAVVTDEYDWGQQPPKLTGLSFCAPSLEAFLYRYGLENELWFAQHPGYGEARSSEALRRRYLDFYREDAQGSSTSIS